MLDDTFADDSTRERRLRRLARAQGFALVKPWCAERRGVGGSAAGYVLVPQGSGISLDEVEAVLTRRLMGRT